MVDNRISWEKYFMNVAILISKRSTCLRRQVGAVAVKNNRIIATGYNGAPSGLTHCIDSRSCLRQSLNIPSGQRHEICRAIHAEANLILQCARSGLSIDSCDVYCTTYPCSMCAKLLIGAGVLNIYYLEHYDDELSASIIKESNIVIKQLDLETL